MSGNPTFVHQELRIVEPEFKSELLDLIISLDYLRKKKLEGSTHTAVFYQLKHIFQTLESLGSARIEGNQTTLAEYVNMSLEKPKKLPSSFKEIRNIENALAFVEENIDDCKINRPFVREIHLKLMADLPVNEESDNTPGSYRRFNVAITKSKHRPPDWIKVEDYMEELFQFINQERGGKYDLLKTAVAHHRFAWIHPFGNGNGRLVRILTYAMLAKQGFNVHRKRLINPTAIFCNNREEYYNHLARADEGSDAGLLAWEEYVLKGLNDEISKLDRLVDYNYLKTEILFPVLAEAVGLKYISDLEYNILSKVVEKQIIQASDIKAFFPRKSDSEVSRQIRILIRKKLLVPEAVGKRKYVLCFYHNLLWRVVYQILDEKGFLPIK